MQGLLDLYESPRYLEVGVYLGETFRSLEATSKVAVDPSFEFDVDEAHSEDPRSVFHEVPSDEYFGRIVRRGDEFDVIFLDGLHIFEQTLRDFNNAVLHLADRGVIIIDDVTPISHLASIPDRRKFNELRQILDERNGSWMGDVYRLVFFIDTFWQQFTCRTIAESNSQLVAWRQPRESVTARTASEVVGMTYEDMLLHREPYSVKRFEEIIGELRDSLGPSEGASHPR